MHNIALSLFVPDKAGSQHGQARPHECALHPCPALTVGCVCCANTTAAKGSKGAATSPLAVMTYAGHSHSTKTEDVEGKWER